MIKKILIIVVCLLVIACSSNESTQSENYTNNTSIKNETETPEIPIQEMEKEEIETQVNATPTITINSTNADDPTTNESINDVEKITTNLEFEITNITAKGTNYKGEYLFNHLYIKVPNPQKNITLTFYKKTQEYEYNESIDCGKTFFKHTGTYGYDDQTNTICVKPFADLRKQNIIDITIDEQTTWQVPFVVRTTEVELSNIG